MEQETSKGIKFEASFGQIFASIMVVLIMFVVPVFVYENLNSDKQKTQEVYTAQALEDRDSKNSSGRVAGVSTKKSENKVVEQLKIISSSKSLILTIGIVLVIVSILLSLALVYDFYKVS